MKMNSLDLLQMASRNLWRRKTRTLLTVLGVVIGTSSIIVMLSLGIAMDRSFKEQISQMGSLNIIEVYSNGYYDPGMSSSQGQQMKLDDGAVSKFKQIAGVEAVMGVKYAYLKVIAGKMVGRISVIGIDPAVMEAFDFKIAQGRQLLASDKDALVFGANIPRNFYNPRLRNQYFNPWDGEAPQVDLISNKLLMTTDMSYGERQTNQGNRDPDYKPPKPHNVRGVGILEESNSEKDYNAYMNITVLEKLLEEDNRVNRQDKNNRRTERNQNKYEQINVKVQDVAQVEVVQEQIKGMGFQTYSLTDMLKSMRETSNKMQAILGGIGAVSLFVAAIGITNTMIMSIYERTREIGVMKVLGADLNDIGKLFLLEAAMIGFCGGVFGLILSYSISFLLNKIGIGIFGGGMGGGTGVSVIPPTLAMAAVAFAILVGILSGYSPARRAMKLSAIEAIKTE